MDIKITVVLPNFEKKKVLAWRVHWHLNTMQIAAKMNENDAGQYDFFPQWVFRMQFCKFSKCCIFCSKGGATLHFKLRNASTTIRYLKKKTLDNLKDNMLWCHLQAYKLKFFLPLIFEKFAKKILHLISLLASFSIQHDRHVLERELKVFESSVTGCIFRKKICFSLSFISAHVCCTCVFCNMNTRYGELSSWRKNLSQKF